MSKVSYNEEFDIVFRSSEERKKDNLRREKSAKIALAAVSLTAFLATNIAGWLYHDCQTNNPTKKVCHYTSIVTMLFGREAGLNHIWADLETHNSMYYDVKDVVYCDPSTTFATPIHNDLDEESDTLYLANTRDGGQRVVKPVSNVDINKNVFYTIEGIDGNITYDSWTYTDSGFVLNVSKDPMVLSYKIK